MPQRLITIFSVVFFINLSIARAETGKYRVMFGADPATEMTIGWEAISGGNHRVYYDTVDHGTDTSAYGFSADPQVTHDYYGMKSQFAELTDLQPAAAYYFVVADDEGTGRELWFLTASDNPTTPFSFIAGGDSRSNRSPRKQGNRLAAKLRPLFILFTGDFIANASSESQWQNWLEDWQLTIAEDGRIIPIVPAQGNHEYTETVEKLFNTPQDVVYAQTFGGSLMRIYTLNTESGNVASQGEWMREDIGENDVSWRLAQYHKPVRPHRSSKSEGNSQYGKWVPIFDEFKFALVHEADAHTVKTTWPIVASSEDTADEGFVRHDSGTIYIGEGCCGAPLRNCDDAKSWTRQCCGSSPFDCFQLIWVDGHQMEIRTVKFDNVDEVGGVGEDWVLSEPNNLQVWDEGGHREILIDRRSSTQVPNPDPAISKHRKPMVQPGEYDLRGASLPTKRKGSTSPESGAKTVRIRNGTREIPELKE